MLLLLSLAIAQEPAPEEVLQKLDDAGVSEVVLSPREGMSGAWTYTGVQADVVCAGMVSRTEHRYGERKGEVDILVTDCVPSGGELAGKLQEATQGTKNLAQRCDAGDGHASHQLGRERVAHVKYLESCDPTSALNPHVGVTIEHRHSRSLA